MTETEIKDTVFDAIRGIAPEAELSRLGPDENLREALDIDSFDFLNLLIAINKKLGVEIPESDYGRLATLSNLVEYLSARAR